MTLTTYFLIGFVIAFIIYVCGSISNERIDAINALGFGLAWPVLLGLIAMYIIKKYIH